ncbi:hypothetical protein CERSUDRAFT_114330 [Gelatoporia subvermispora B]|uniref:sphinganine-1-phosphate aldolase n=1 Tax=Ceriporiopsis subvermispora (strain B) TaxID=914234 RepID=M2RGU0_CERS8|nr:hypothetical protein CERSUDRAFT_114330 [Gelatoporia subvermispora B]
MDAVLSSTRLRALYGSSPLEHIKTLVIAYLLLKQTLQVYRHLRARGVIQSVQDACKWAVQEVMLLALRLPAARRKVDTELGKARIQIESKMIAQGPGVTRHLALPENGKTPDWILHEMEKMDAEFDNHSDWRDGKISGAVYHGGEDLMKVIMAAMERYSVSNPLHPDVFPSVRKMEAEIVAMCLKMYNNPNGAGATTSGGTESIVLAVKTYREWARAVKGITKPEMVIPETAHVAFDKGAAYFGIKTHTIPVDPITRQVNIKRVARAINANTIMIVGSAVNFPDGCQDDIVSLGQLATKHKIGLHVDCCLGSFIMPFLEEAGFPVKPFDFRVQGVTSISCDTHKYGFAPKGNSVIMYRNPELRRHQYYINPDWVGGLYASPTIAGSRPGAILAGTWAALQYMGHSGYLESCKSIVSAARRIAHGITEEIPELYVLGNPPASVVAFGSNSADISALEVGDAMSRKGWHLNGLSRPGAVHIAVTRLTVPHVDEFIADLKDSVREARFAPPGKGTMMTLYGLGSSSPVGPRLVGRVAEMFLDTLYKA